MLASARGRTLCAPYTAFTPHQYVYTPPQIPIAFRIQLRYTFNKPFPALRDIVKENN